MKAIDLLEFCQSNGVRLTLSKAGRLKIGAPGELLTDDLISELKKHKDEISRLLARQARSERFAETARRLRAKNPLPLRIASTKRGLFPMAQRSARHCSDLPVPWPGDAADFCLLLTPDDLPEVPFDFSPGIMVMDAGKFLTWLKRDIKLGENSPRAVTGALQRDLVRLRELLIKRPSS